MQSVLAISTDASFYVCMCEFEHLHYE